MDLWNTFPPATTKSKKGIFSLKVNVTHSLTLGHLKKHEEWMENMKTLSLMVQNL